MDPIVDHPFLLCPSTRPLDGALPARIQRIPLLGGDRRRKLGADAPLGRDLVQA
jgi:hypothetical protein